MRPSRRIAGEPLLKEPYDFSLVLGGPLYQFWRRTHLVGDTLEWMCRRVVVLALLAWAPLLLLSLAEGHAWGTSVKLPFLYDVEVHVRLLLAVPLLIVAELVVHQRMHAVAWRFVEDGLIPDGSRAQFEAAIAAALRLRNSVAAEVLLIAVVYGVGVLFVWRTQVALDVASWYGVTVEGKLRPSLAGWWLGCVSLPLFQFLLLRWYFRLFIWARFLWQVSRVELRLMPAHPDRWRLGLPRRGELRVLAAVAGSGGNACRDDGQPDFLRWRQTARVQGRTHRIGGRHGIRDPRAASGVQSATRSGQARRPAGIRNAGAALRPRVQLQMAARRRSGG
jgi:hypothetical protein